MGDASLPVWSAKRPHADVRSHFDLGSHAPSTWWASLVFVGYLRLCFAQRASTLLHDVVCVTYSNGSLHYWSLIPLSKLTALIMPLFLRDLVRDYSIFIDVALLVLS